MILRKERTIEIPVTSQIKFRKSNKHYLKAYTLAELLIVLAIIGILVLLAMPNFTSVINKARSTEAKMQLKFLYDLQKSHQLTENEYASDLDELGFIQEKLVTEEGEAMYAIQIVQADEITFQARAVAVKDFDGDGNFNTWEINQNKELRETIKD